MKDANLNDTTIIWLYIFYNLIYAIFSYPLGILADKIWMKKILFFGFSLFVVVYIWMAYVKTSILFLILFFLYGIYAWATEWISKAWITNICKKEDTATAIWTYTAFQSIASLIASSWAGLIWYLYWSWVVFLVSGIVVVFIAIYILRIREKIIN
jgi:MFS family permease